MRIRVRGPAVRPETCETRVAAGRNRTDMGLPPRDFKSLVYTSSTTAARREYKLSFSVQQPQSLRRKHGEGLRCGQAGDARAAIRMNLLRESAVPQQSPH